MLKRIIALLLAAILICCLAACGSTSAPKGDTSSAPKSDTASAPKGDTGSAPKGDTAAAVPGVTDDKILIGGTVPLSGTVASCSQYFKGMDAYFAKVNEAGGVHGRKIEFLYYDDAYEPAKTVSNVKRLVEEDKVFMTVIHGTSCTLAAMDYLIEKQVPDFSIGGSMAMLNNNVVFTAYIPFPEEGAAMGEYLVSEGYKNIAIIRANDDTGGSYLDGLVVPIEAAGMKVTDVVYNAADVDYSSYVLSLMKQNPDVVVIQGVAATAGKILEAAETLGFAPQWAGFSAGADKSIMDLAPTASKNMIFSYFLPLLDSDDPKAIAHEELVSKYTPGQNPNLFTMNGQAIAEVIVEALERLGPDVSREGFIKTVESISGWEDGILSTLSYSSTLHAPSGQGIYFIQVQDGKFVKIAD